MLTKGTIPVDLPKIKVSKVISCSRRTDIPAFNMDWLIACLHEGHVDVPNPFTKTQVSRISLRPGDVRCWVWWSKNFGPWIQAFDAHPDLFDPYHHYFQFTINSPSEVESNLHLTLEDRIKQVSALIARGMKPGAIMWRHDPLVRWQDMASGEIKQNWNLADFEKIATQVADLGIKEVTFAFATYYPKVRKRMERRGKEPMDPPLDEKLEVVRDLARISSQHHLTLRSCCGSPKFLELGVKESKCVDGDTLNLLFNADVETVRAKGQRDACRCSDSRDIGRYDGQFLCRHNCDYCYANPRPQ